MKLIALVLLAVILVSPIAWARGQTYVWQCPHTGDIYMKRGIDGEPELIIRKDKQPSGPILLEPSQAITPAQEPSPAVSNLVPQNDNETTYIASEQQEAFHHIGCSHAQQIKPDNLISFSSREEAVQSGRRPCRSCNP